jgi:phosphoglycolate phosphatase
VSDSLDGVVDDVTFARGRAAFDRHYQRENGRWAKPYAGVMTGLQRLAERRFPMACVTNKPQAFADPLLDQHGMAQFFQVTLGGDALDRRKPDPAPLLHAAGLMQVDPASCLMVGDSVNDAAAARAAGMPVVILPYGYNEGRSVQTIDCDGIVESIEAVADLLAGDHE